MNLFKKITVAFMCMCMFFAFAACGGGGNGGGGSTNDGAIDYNGTINIKCLSTITRITDLNE